MSYSIKKKTTKNIIRHINEYGFIKIKSVFDKNLCKDLKEKIKKRKGQRFYKNLKEFKKNGRYYKTNPDLKFNYLNNFDHEHFDINLQKILPGKIIGKKIIRNVRKQFLPNWLKKYAIFLVGNINPYMKAKYQDESHFYGIHMHQDGLGSEKIFITAYIYLDDVGKNNSPLEMFEKSHLLHISKGSPIYPIHIKKIKNKYLYFNKGNTMFTKKKIITGETGDLILFDSRCVHLTKVNASKEDRISLRYLIKTKDKVKKIIKSKHLTFGMQNDHLFLMGG